jgi:hypothetical protein
MTEGKVVSGLFYKKDSKKTEEQIKRELGGILGEVEYEEKEVKEMGGMCVLVMTEEPFTFAKFDNYSRQLEKVLMESEYKSISPLSLYMRGDEFIGVGFRTEKTTKEKLENLSDSIPKLKWEEESDPDNNKWLCGKTEKPIGSADFEAIYAELSHHLSDAELSSLISIPNELEQ